MKLTAKQEKGFALLANDDYREYLFHGSSRTGKTLLIVVFIIAYCYRYREHKIRCLLTRHQFSHVKSSLWSQTLLPFLQENYKGHYTINKSDYIVTIFGCEIWIAGLEEGDRLEKILGTEWALIYNNELTLTKYDAYNTLKSRLNWKGVPVKYINDCNPKAPSHWVHRYYLEKVYPDNRNKMTDKLSKKIVHMNWHVFDNKENLSEDYLEILETMTGVKKKRLFDGVWSEISEGTVYRFSRQVNLVEDKIEVIPGAQIWASFDFGIADDVFIVWYQVVPVPSKMGFEIHIIDEYFNNEKAYDYYADICNEKPYNDVRYAGDPTGTARGATKESWFSLLATKGIIIHKNTKMRVADYISNANRLMPVVRVNECQCPKIVEMFENWSYKKDKDGKVVENSLPVHDEYSHPGSAFYYGLGNSHPPIANKIILP